MPKCKNHCMSNISTKQTLTSKNDIIYICFLELANKNST